MKNSKKNEYLEKAERLQLGGEDWEQELLYHSGSKAINEEERQLKNKEAVQRSRNRKTVYIRLLERKVEDLQVQNATLRRECQDYKTQLFQFWKDKTKALEELNRIRVKAWKEFKRAGGSCEQTAKVVREQFQKVETKEMFDSAIKLAIEMTVPDVLKFLLMDSGIASHKATVFEAMVKGHRTAHFWVNEFIDKCELSPEVRKSSEFLALRLSTEKQNLTRIVNKFMGLGQQLFLVVGEIKRLFLNFRESMEYYNLLRVAFSAQNLVFHKEISLIEIAKQSLVMQEDRYLTF